MKNDGNSEDNFEVGLDESSITLLKDAGFLFEKDEFTRFQLASGATASENISIIAPENVQTEKTLQLTLVSESIIDGNLENIDSVSFTVTLKPDSGGAVGGLDFDSLSSISNDDMKIYAMAGAGFVGFILLLIVISKMAKKATAKADSKHYSDDEPLDVEEDDDLSEFDDLDFSGLDDELDDLGEDLQDLDDDFDFEDL